VTNGTSNTAVLADGHDGHVKQRCDGKNPDAAVSIPRADSPMS